LKAIAGEKPVHFMYKEKTAALDLTPDTAVSLSAGMCIPAISSSLL
jgi:hypothetical protein